MNLRSKLAAIAFPFSFAAGFLLIFFATPRFSSHILAIAGFRQDLTLVTSILLLTVFPFALFVYFGKKFDFYSRFASNSLFLVLTCLSACFFGLLSAKFSFRYLGYDVYPDIIASVIVPGFFVSALLSAWEFLIMFAGLIIGSSMRKVSPTGHQQVSNDEKKSH